MPDTQRPNIVAIMIDDMCPMDLSAYHRGLGAVHTPNMDRLAQEGITVSDYYAQPSCTAGRAAFITGQYPIRTGLTSVGQPGSKVGHQAGDITIAALLKDLGYATALIGKSHLGDRNEFLPTVHGFDEFKGFLYHLNMMEMPEQPDFPKDETFAGRPRNMIQSWASDVDDPTEHPRWGRVGKQKIEDLGPLTSEHMGTIDDEFTGDAIDYVRRQKAADTPFFLWYCPSRMHQQIHVSKHWLGKSGHTPYFDAVLQLDALVGRLLDALDAEGLTDNTIVLLTSDNGVNLAHWPMAGTASFRGEKGTTWDGGFRVPMLARWPGHIAPGSWTGEFMTSEDWLPTLLAVAGQRGVKEELLKGKRVGGREYKLHLDGYDQLDMLTQPGGKSRRREFFFFAETELTALRVDGWKLHLAIKDAWLEAARKLTGGMIIDIKADPYERSPETGGHFLWMKEKSWIMPILAAPIQAFVKSLDDFPPSQKGTGIGAAALLSTVHERAPTD
ncbi:MAG: sulfatase [Phenylobacterium sp.]|uniref:arylsulfatase n=1 Tax=Phenylobacterium sp. TaxID=1871053 RepID=UPI0025EE40BD|nr:arylsulfatase [Phenylobacterium sp.]MBA4013106.1 sulfatase [Phenylobacterium sp.]